MLKMVGLLDMDQMSRGLVSCQSCNADGYGLYMLFHLHGLHEAHRADVESVHLPFDVCIQVRSTVCYDAKAACKVFKLYISTTQSMLP